MTLAFATSTAPEPVEIISIAPAVDVWAVYAYGGSPDKPRYGREPVRMWALVRLTDGTTAVLPLVESSGERHCGLDFVDESYRWLYNEVSGGRCSCGYINPPRSTGDRWWCTTCAAVIEPA